MLLGFRNLHNLKFIVNIDNMVSKELSFLYGRCKPVSNKAVCCDTACSSKDVSDQNMATYCRVASSIYEATPSSQQYQNQR